MPTQEVVVGDRARLSERVEPVDPLLRDVEVHETVTVAAHDLLRLLPQRDHRIVLFPAARQPLDTHTADLMRNGARFAPPVGST